MLGRTANQLFWMFRYLERVENTARLIEAGLRMALTRDVVAAEEEWRSIITTAGQHGTYEERHGTYSGIQAWNFLLRDKTNPGSVLATYGKVRQNARAARGSITGELWEAINDNWLALSRELERPVGDNRVLELVGRIRRAATLANGALHTSMLRNEIFHFARAGMLVERADNTARILDIKYYLLLPAIDWVGSSLDTGQWENVLRSVSGDRAYRWLNSGQIDARGICEFLIFDERFPRSLAFAHSELRGELDALARIHGHEGECHALMREADMRRAELTIDEVFEGGLHECLTSFVGTNAAIAEAIASDYRFLE